jgi:CheY-like chemotaxis protein
VGNRYTRAADSGFDPPGRNFKQMDTTPAAGTSILVVDDEPQVVWVLQFSLEAEGYQTFAANNGVEALSEISEHRPTLMVLDIMMPTMDGWSVLEEMMKLPREERPRVVVVSALASLRDRAKAAELGADAYVPKPFNVDELLEVLHGLEEAS